MGKQEPKVRGKSVLGKGGKVRDSATGANTANNKEERIKSLIEENALAYGLAPSFLATIALSEDLERDYLNLKVRYGTKVSTTIKNDITIRGAEDVGTDYLMREYGTPEIYPSGIFDQGRSGTSVNSGTEVYGKEEEKEEKEKEEKKESSVLNAMNSAVWACAATLAHRRDVFQKHRQALALPSPSDDQLAYWTYIYYQGEVQAHHCLKISKALDIHKLNSANAGGAISPSNRRIHDAALSNLASWKYVQEFQFFSR